MTKFEEGSQKGKGKSPGAAKVALLKKEKSADECQEAMIPVKNEEVVVKKENMGACNKKPAKGKIDETMDDIEDSLLLIPKELVEEEEKVRVDNEESAEKFADSLGSNNLTKAERYKKLMDLLGKSAIYSNYLRNKMEANDEAAVLKRTKMEDRKKLKEKQMNEVSKKKPCGTKKRPAEEEEDDEPLAEPGAKRMRPELRKFKGEHIPDEQPFLLSGGIMRDYQIKGYQWIATLFENDINGILADEMGLGKTIQTIALFCHMVEMGVPGPFLIVAPLSTVPNWVNEFKRFAPLFPTVLYHGSKAAREELRCNKLRQTEHVDYLDKKIKNVFITSFEIAMNDRPFLAKVNWRFIVVDEGHRLKNMNCKLLRELKHYHSVNNNKLLLTGTPLQNNLQELWSLLNFIMPDIFDDLRVFESWFDAYEMDENPTESERIIQQEKQNNILSTLHQILTPFLLRRVKADVDLKIPPKKEVLVYCPMSARQRELYEAIVNRTIMELVSGKKEEQPKLEVSEETGRSIRQKNSVDYLIFMNDDEGASDRKFEDSLKKLAEYQHQRDARNATSNAYKGHNPRATSDVCISLKNSLMGMRKATNHPYLIEYPLTEDGFYDATNDMIDICGKLKVLDQMLAELLQRKHKVLIFSQMTRMLDILGDYINLRNYKFSRLDGNMPFEDRQKNIDSFNNDPEVKIFLLSTRAGGLGINLTAADTCIIYDSDWNPQQDLQAQDRCHRIGQTKPVMVYRLVTANTIDQRIVERAGAKRTLEKMVIHSKKFKSQDREGLKMTMEPITPQELLELLNSDDYAGVIDRADEAIFSQEELDALLDRSTLSWSKIAAKGTPAGKQKGKKATKGRENKFKLVETEDAGMGVLQSVKED